MRSFEDSWVHNLSWRNVKFWYLVKVAKQIIINFAYAALDGCVSKNMFQDQMRSREVRNLKKGQNWVNFRRFSKLTPTLAGSDIVYAGGNVIYFNWIYVGLWKSDLKMKFYWCQGIFFMNFDLKMVEKMN